MRKIRRSTLSPKKITLKNDDDDDDDDDENKNKDKKHRIINLRNGDEEEEEEEEEEMDDERVHGKEGRSSRRMDPSEEIGISTEDAFVGYTADRAVSINVNTSSSIYHQFHE